MDWQGLQPCDVQLTSCYTPEYNSLVECVFPKLTGRARAMMGSAQVPDKIRGKVAIEALKCIA